MIFIIGLVVGIHIIISEVKQIGHQKSHLIELLHNQEFTYDVAHSIPLSSANWWWTNELFPRIRDFQQNHQNDTNIFQHRMNRLIPLDYSDFDWFDHEYAQWFVCNNTQVFFRKQKFIDAVGAETYAENTYFDFKCNLMMFANDKIRSYFYVPLNKNEALARFENTAKTSIGKKTLSEEEKRIITFEKSNSVKTQVITKYSENMHGLRNIAAFWHNANVHNLTLKFNNWNFTSSKMWDGTPDSFYYHPNSTLLAMSQIYTIGSQQIGKIIIPLTPEKFVDEHQVVTKSVLGLPIEWKDNVEDIVTYHPSLDLNMEYLIEVKPQFNITDIFMNL